MSTVIKANGPTRQQDAASFNFDDIGNRAQAFLEQTRRQAAEILAQAEQDAVAIRRRAEELGQQAALATAERLLDEKMGRQLQTLMPALHEAIQRIHNAKAAWLSHWEKTAVHVSAAIAGRVIRREVARAPEITLTLVREALELAAGSGDVQLRLNPEDLATLGPQVERLKNELSRLGNSSVVADAEIAPGGCRVDTRFGIIDQQFAAQLARIEQELT